MSLPEARARSGRGRLLPFLRACERPNVGDVYSPRGEVTLVTDGNEAARPELAQKGGRGSFLLFCERASDQTSEMYILPVEKSRQ